MERCVTAERAAIQLSERCAIVGHPCRLSTGAEPMRADSGGVTNWPEARPSDTGSDIVRVSRAVVLESAVKALERDRRAVFKTVIQVTTQPIPVTAILIVTLTPFNRNRTPCSVNDPCGLQIVAGAVVPVC